MTSEIDEFRSSLVAAVQAELERHASAVVAEVDRLRVEGRAERAELRAELDAQLKALRGTFDQSLAKSAQQAEQARTVLEQRVTESEQRQTRRLDDVSSGLEAMVHGAVRPLLQEVRDDQAAVVNKVEGLDTNLRKFDEQAARMVTYFNDLTRTMEHRQEETIDVIRQDVAAQVSGLKALVDENDLTVRRFQTEVGQSVTQKLNDAEDRFNNRLLAAESRMKEEAGQKIADIDAHVGRVSAGLDETMTVLNDRIAGIDDKFATSERRIDEIEQSVAGIDQDAIEELKDKMSAAAGEAMLVRIEVERFQKGVNDKTDELSIRLTEVETNLADATMDVSTAVQLDRLEEIERALLLLDPDQFVRRGEIGGDSLKEAGTRADAHGDGHLDAAARALGDVDPSAPQADAAEQADQDVGSM